MRKFRIGQWVLNKECSDTMFFKPNQFYPNDIKPFFTLMPLTDAEKILRPLIDESIQVEIISYDEDECFF